jgi:hypothetical protein
MTQDDAKKLLRLARTYAANEAQAAEHYAANQDKQADRYGKKAEALWKELEAFVATLTKS